MYGSLKIRQTGAVIHPFSWPTDPEKLTFWERSIKTFIGSPSTPPPLFLSSTETWKERGGLCLSYDLQHQLPPMATRLWKHLSYLFYHPPPPNPHVHLHTHNPKFLFYLEHEWYIRECIKSLLYYIKLQQHADSSLRNYSNCIYMCSLVRAPVYRIHLDRSQMVEFAFKIRHVVWRMQFLNRQQLHSTIPMLTILGRGVSYIKNLLTAIMPETGKAMPT